MKKLILTLSLIIAILCNVKGNGPMTIQANGSYLIGICGDTIVLRGINYAAFNWGNDFSDDRFAEIAMSGANCVRIPWYSSSAAGGGAPLYDHLEYLDSAITQCNRNKMIAIIVLMDNTCDSNYSSLLNLSNWYLQTGVESIITANQQSLIIDVANEAGYVQWSSNSAQALIDYKNTYQTIVSNFRTAGINVPIMIDAPDCGSDIDDMASVANALQTADPNHNMIFSAHAYWYAYANNDSATMRNKITNALSQNVPIVLGEVANLQDGSTACMYVLNYQPLLEICQELNVNWLSWSWDHDVCSARQISSNGMYANLTTYGSDILNNPNYGITNHSELTTYLANNGNCTSTGLSVINNSNSVSLFPNPVSGNSILQINSKVKGVVNIIFYDLMGQIVLIKNGINKKTEIDKKDFNTGMYFYRVSINDEFIATGKFIVE